MTAYVSFIPPRSFDTMINRFVGGQFWDGRADTLESQAKGPFLNPLEMNMPNKRAVVSRIADSSYASDFLAVFGPGSLSPSDADAAYDRVASAIAAYKRTAELNPFSSKHDYAMTRTGSARMMTFTMQERQGMMLFNGKARCWECHTTPMGGMGGGMGGGGMGMVPNQIILFSDYRYENLGIPRNPANPYYALKSKWNLDGATWIDHGLASAMPGGVAANPQLDGLFKTPSPPLSGRLTRNARASLGSGCRSRRGCGHQTHHRRPPAEVCAASTLYPLDRSRLSTMPRYFSWISARSNYPPEQRRSRATARAPTS